MEGREEEERKGRRKKIGRGRKEESTVVTTPTLNPITLPFPPTPPTPSPCTPQPTQSPTTTLLLASSPNNYHNSLPQSPNSSPTKSTAKANPNRTKIQICSPKKDGTIRRGGNGWQVSVSLNDFIYLLWLCLFYYWDKVGGGEV